LRKVDKSKSPAAPRAPVNWQPRKTINGVGDILLYIG